jgi:hypothetical protein
MFELRSSQLRYITLCHEVKYTEKIKKDKCKIIKIRVFIISYTRYLLIISAHFNSCIGHELNEAATFQIWYSSNTLSYT